MKKLTSRIVLIALGLSALCSCSRLGTDENNITGGRFSDDTASVRLLLDSFEYFKNINQLSNALPFAEQALILSEKLHYEDDITNALQSIGLYFASTGDYPEAMKYHLRALELNERSENEKKMAKNLSDIGIIYYHQKRYQDAIQYYERAVKLHQKLENDKGIAVNRYLIGLVYFELGADSAALNNLNIALELQKQLKENKRIAEVELAVGDIFLRRKEYAEALRLYNNSVFHFAEANETMGPPTVNLSLSKLFLQKGELDRAEKYALLSYEYFTRVNYKKRVVDAYTLLSKISFEKKDFEKAFVYKTRLEALNDSMLGEENAMKLANLETKYKLDKKQIEIEHQQRQIKTQQTLRNVFMGGFVIVAVLAFIAFVQYRVKKKTSVKLEITLRNLEKTQEHLIHKEKMSSLGELSAGIAHEIRNPLNFVTNFSDLTVHLINEYRNSSSAEEQNELLRDIGTNLDKINQHGKRADRIVENMLSQVHKGAGEKKPVNLNSLSEEFFTLALQSARLKDPNFDCEVEKKYDDNLPLVNANEQEISRVLINLFNNALYELRKKKIVEGNNYVPKISIASYASASKVFFSVSDNGPGISDELRAKIFQPFFTTKGMGEGTGLGLSLSREVIEQGHQGKLEVISSEGKGSKFIISLPA